MKATILASLAVILFLIKTTDKNRHKDDISLLRNIYISALLSGIMFANGSFHFVHGVLGMSDFPAPFAKIFGHGIVSNISNVIWGVFNFIISFVSIRRCRNFNKKILAVLLFLIGLVMMSILLRFVLLKNYFQTHTF